MAKFKCPYKFPATSRREMARYIAFNCTPYHYNGGVSPLVYNVKVYVTADFGYLWRRYGVEMLTEAGVQDPFVMSEMKPRLQHYYETQPSLMFEEAIEYARHSVNEGDTHKLTWDGDKTHKVEFEFWGRQGGHLCVTEIDGYSTKIPPHELYDTLMCVDYFSKLELREIYKLAVQWDSDFTQQKAGEEVRYQLAWNLFVRFTDSFLTQREAA